MTEIITAYSGLLAALPPFFQSFINLFFLALLIVVYAVFIWKFHRFLGTRNIFDLNLNKYNKAEHPLTIKIIAAFFYLLEYIVLLPFLIFFWFAVFTLFLILLNQDVAVSTLLTLSVSIIAAIRMTTYIPRYGENLAKEIAKVFPLTLLVVSLVTKGFFNFERVIGQLSEIPTFLSQILHYLLFIIILEVILRFFEFVFSITGLEDEEEEKKDEKEKV